MAVAQIVVLLASLAAVIAASATGMTRARRRPWLGPMLALFAAVLANLGTHVLVAQGSVLGLGLLLAAAALLVPAFR